MTYAPATDLHGTPLHPGDHVSAPLYPRGTIRGVVVISPTWTERQPDGSWLPALVLEAGGKVYSLGGKARKLRGKKV